MRALAQGPQFWEAQQAGSLTEDYRRELDAKFGPEGAAAGHQDVKEEHARLRALQGKEV